jgi:hypothetical protein
MGTRDLKILGAVLFAGNGGHHSRHCGELSGYFGLKMD